MYCHFRSLFFLALVIVSVLVTKGFLSHCGNCVALECGTSTENIIEIQLFLLSCRLQKIKHDYKGLCACF